MFDEEAEKWVMDNVCKDCSRYEKCKSKEHCTCKECSKEKWQAGAEYGWHKKCKEILDEIKHLREGTKNEAEVLRFITNVDFSQGKKGEIFILEKQEEEK